MSTSLGASDLAKAALYAAARILPLFLYVAAYAVIMAFIITALWNIEYAAIGRAVLLFLIEDVPTVMGAAYYWAAALPVFAQVVVGLLLVFVGGPILLVCIGAVFAAGEWVLWIFEKGAEVIVWLTVIPALLFMREVRRFRAAIRARSQPQAGSN